uniref:Potassium channel subfamily K member 18 n=1 Tax=Schistocephalus solidus TaxID=70667 RepID=A0A0V0J8Z8_SCHSO
METIVSMEELSSKPSDECKYSCCGCYKKKKQNTTISKLPAPPMRYACVRKCTAVTCSILGLLLAIIVYLSIGSVLFRYLERDAQQARLVKGLSLLNDFISTYELGGKSVQKRADYFGSRTVEKHLASYCLDQQFEAVISELQRLSAKKVALKSRVAEVIQLRERAGNVTAAEELEELAAALHIPLGEQVETFSLLLHEHTQAPWGIRKKMGTAPTTDVLTNVYEAVLAGWRPSSSPKMKLFPPATRPDRPSPRSFIGVKEPSPSDLTPLFDNKSTKTDPWTYSGALFYAVTVITTIGYGHIVPTTTLGKICTIIYGFFGIPLMLLFLANLGSLMADFFRLGYQHICQCNRDKKERSPVQKPLPKSSPINKLRTCSTGQVDSKTRQARKTTVLATVVPRAGSSSPALRDRPGRTHKTPPMTRALHHLVQKPSLPGVTDSLFVSLMGTNSFFARAVRARQQSRTVRVPVLLTLFIFFVYLFGGALIFSHWENWSFTDAIYFVFITISTIGFGDLILGIEDDDFGKQTRKFLAAITYLLFGLALVCMCFDLMQRELKRKSKRLAQRIGLIDSQ